MPPFPGEVVKVFNPKKSSFLQHHGELIPLIAKRDGKAVGRIAVVVNKSHNKFYNDKIGFFGFFDFINDFEVAKALYDAAREELIKRGFTAIRGPYNPSINDECGLLIEGFDSIPYIMMPHNPEYYVGIYEKLGLDRKCRMHAFFLDSKPDLSERLQKIALRAKTRIGIEIRNINMDDISGDLAHIVEIYNATLKRNWGFVPVTLEDLEFSAQDLKKVVKPYMVMIAEKNGRPVGFSMAIPNLNEFLHKAKSKSTLLFVLKFLWLFKTRHPKYARLAALGVHPDFQNKGLGVLFYYESLMRGRQAKYLGGELSWCQDTNSEIIHGITAMGAKIYKNYGIYEAPLTQAN